MRLPLLPIILSLALNILQTPLARSETALDLPGLVKNGSIRVERSDGTPLLNYNDEALYVPASILKVATSFCAIEELGANFRFETLFSTDTSNTLYITGSGDPSLISETLEAIAIALAKKLPRIDRIVIDTSLFADNLLIDGSESSLNPYDAKNAAFVGNYSSAALSHTKRGEILSAEPQTPLTPIARQAGQRLPRGRTDRVNLSSDWRTGVRYGGELLAAFLRQHGVKGALDISLGLAPKNLKIIHKHSSPLTLKEISREMLKYSTNFTANQLFLVLGAQAFGAPATVEKGQKVMNKCLAERIGWRGFHIEEGSGLSRKNKVSTSQMTELLKAFERYSSLLPEKDGFLAKTGSLRGVNSLAGYFNLGLATGDARFCIIINSEVPHLYKFHVASEIRRYLQGAAKGLESPAANHT
jgi:D-alanyl-D-alanine carboxypeptidase/D-alanyl-D-alanine-endopeptidase (penicillin-binding protein 4)